MKKIFTLMLALVMALSTIPAAVLAETPAIPIRQDGRLVISEAGEYTLTGSMKGMVYVDPGEGDVTLILDNMNIQGGSSAGIVAVSGSTLKIRMADQSQNVVANMQKNEYKAAIYSMVPTSIEGNGNLEIQSAQYGIQMGGAPLNIASNRVAFDAQQNVYMNSAEKKKTSQNNENQTMPAKPESDNQNQSVPSLPESSDQGQSAPAMPGDMGGMPGGQNQNVTYASEPSEIVTSSVENTAADLEVDRENATTYVMTDEDSQVKITSSGTYVVTGSSSSGNITVKKGTTGVVLVLEDLDLTSTTGATVSVNKQAEVKIVISGNVILTDNENPDDENAEDEEVADAYDGAALKVKADSQVYITGDGALTINGNAKNGIKGGDDSSIVVDGEVTINITAANDGINSNYDITLLNGDFTIDAGDDAIHADHILTVGKEDGTGPSIHVASSYEGLEATVVNIFDGEIDITASDDGINAANSDNTYADELDFSINMTGGTVNINAGSDGLDSNGNVNLIGGSLTIHSASMGGEAGIDYDGELYVSDEININNASGIAGPDEMPGEMNGQMPGNMPGQVPTQNDQQASGQAQQPGQAPTWNAPQMPGQGMMGGPWQDQNAGQNLPSMNRP